MHTGELSQSSSPGGEVESSGRFLGSRLRFYPFQNASSNSSFLQPTSLEPTIFIFSKFGLAAPTWPLQNFFNPKERISKEVTRNSSRPDEEVFGETFIWGNIQVMKGCPMASEVVQWLGFGASGQKEEVFLWGVSTQHLHDLPVVLVGISCWISIPKKPQKPFQPPHGHSQIFLPIWSDFFHFFWFF